MKLAPDENLIARELVEGFPITLKGYKLFQSMSEIDINERVVRLYYRLLSEYPDPLIIAKFGKDKAVEVMKKAKKATHRSDFETLDRELLQKKINPGTIADLTSSSLFLSLIRGLRF
jgi:triphosphoribosyl-dephospho-CoA synthase